MNIKELKNTVVKKNIFFTAKTSFKIEDFLDNYDVKAFAVYDYLDRYQVAICFSESPDIKVSALIGGETIERLVVCRSYANALTYIDTVLPSSSIRASSLVKEKLLPLTLRNNEIEAVFDKIDTMSSIDQLQNDPEVKLFMRSNPEKVYSYFKLIHAKG